MNEFLLGGIAALWGQVKLVDPALGRPMASGDASRPGRLDRVIEVPPMNHVGAHRIIERILGEWPDEVRRVYATITDGMTAAQVTERCVETALKRFWRDQ